MQTQIVVAALESTPEAHAERTAQLRQRRAEFAESRGAAGVTAHAEWIDTNHGLVITRFAADSTERAAELLAQADGPFEQWYAEAEHHLTGGPVVTPSRMTAEVVASYRTRDDDPFELFLCLAVALLPERTDAFVELVSDPSRHEAALGRLRRWGLTRMDLWVQRGDIDYVVYDVAGDLTEMLRDLSTGDDGEMRQQRAMVREMFGIDLRTDAFPVPVPGFAWSA